jgi:Negative regulator of sigma F
VTCRDISRWLAAGEPLPAAAADHLQTCEACRMLVEFSPYSEEAPIDAKLEERLCLAAMEGLAPVRRLHAPWICTAGLLAMAAGTAFVGIVLLGTRGWATTSIVQKLYFVASFITGIAVCSAILPRMMFPGASLRIRPWVLSAAAIAAVLGGGALYPVLRYAHFARAAAACFSIAIAHAAVMGAGAALILRHGLVLSRRTSAALAGLLGGLTGAFVLFVFCPHLDAGHYLLGHATAVIAATALGPAIVALLDRS